ncbi:NYN domain-containing protein [Patescibacteria group bacterium]|nr:NYN domain-containing protein [Patescibacteria group bacterium]
MALFKGKKKSELSVKSTKIAVFIDAGNLWEVYKKIGKMIEVNKLESFFKEKFSGDIFKIFYYVAYPEDGTRPQVQIDKIHKFLTYLKKGLEFEVIKKPLKTINLRDKKGELIYDQDTGEIKTKEKGNLDVEFTIDVIKYSTAYDIAVFVTGDSDFLPLISYLRNLGGKAKKVYIFSTEGCISNELRTGGDGYFDLKNCVEIHGCDLKNQEDR